MFYVNGGSSGKKKAIQDIFKVVDEPNDKEEIRDDRDDRDDGSRSRSRSRISNRSEIESKLYSDDTDDESDDAATEDSNTNPDENNNHDYIVTSGRNMKEGIHHHHYSFVENELDYDIEEFTEKHPEIKEFDIIIYRINTRSTLPFLEFLFYYENSSCKLPYYHHNSKKNIRKECDEIMNHLFTSKYRFKGYIYDESMGKCVIFYEKYFRPEQIKITQISLTKSHNWYWLCSTEIMNHQKYMTLSIDEDAILLFMAYPLIGVLQKSVPITAKDHAHSRKHSERFYDENIEVPSILYYGSTLCYAENTSKYGLKREPIIARFGPFYYFTTLEHSYYWACYHNTSKGVKEVKNAQGGISRYAVFTGDMKTVFQDDDYDEDTVKKYIERKNIFETKINQYRQTQEEYQRGIYDSIYSYDYSWTENYDTIYNGYYSSKKILRPIWCVCDHNHFQMLSYYEVDMRDLPSSYNPDYTDYNIL